MQVAWAVSRLNSDSYGSMDTVNFDSVEVNIGNVWDNTTNSVIIPLQSDGIYYVHLMASTCCCAGYEITLNLNEAPLFTIYHNMVTMWRGSVREKAAIVKLKVEDVLSVSLPSSSCCIYGGNNEKQTAFNGFRLA